MIICRKCQRQHADDVGRGPCDCGADLARDGIAVGSSPMAGSSVFDDLETDPAPTPPAPAVPPPGADPATVTPPPEDPPPPPDKPTRRAGSFTPADVASVESDPQPDVATEPVAAVVEAPESATEAERSRRARGVTPAEVLAAREEPDAPNVGQAPPDTGGDAGPVPSGLDTTQPIPSATREPREGEISCPVCREPNADVRRFCFNCGTKLPTPDYDDEDELTPEMLATQKRSWWSRLTGSDPAKRTARTFSGRAKRAAGGKFQYASGFSSRFKLTAVVGVLLAGGGIMALLGPYRGLIGGVLDRGPEGTSPESAEVVGADEVPGFAAGDAVDEDDETGFAVIFDPDGDFTDAAADLAASGILPGDDDAEADDDGAAAPGGSAGETPSATLVVRLDEPRRVGTLHIAAGLPDSVDDGPLMLRPSRVRVCSGAENCQELELDNSTSLEEYDVSFPGDVSIIRLTVIDVHEADTTAYPLAVISEIRVDG